MAVCDRLEANLAAEGDIRSRLLDALVHEALDTADQQTAAALRSRGLRRF